MVRVPVPLRVPLTRMAPAADKVGLAPSGKVQLLLIVFVPAVLAMFTTLNVTLLQLTVEELPSNVTVPPLWLKVPPEIVTAPDTNMSELGAVKTPLLRVKVLLISSVPALPEKVPPLMVIAPPIVRPIVGGINVPLLKVMLASEPGLYALQSTVGDPERATALRARPVKPERV